MDSVRATPFSSAAPGGCNSSAAVTGGCPETRRVRRMIHLTMTTKPIHNGIKINTSTSRPINITSNILYFLSMRLNSSTNGEHRRFPPRQCALNRHAQQALPSILRRRDVPVPSSLFSTTSPIPMEQPFSAPGLPHKRYVRTDTSYASKDVRAPPEGLSKHKKSPPEISGGLCSIHSRVEHHAAFRQ